jgi:atypical dual specificity phosphatase
MTFLVLLLLVFVDVFCQNTAAIGSEDAQLVIDNIWLGSCASKLSESLLTRFQLILTLTPRIECDDVHLPNIEFRRFGLLDDGMHAVTPLLPSIFNVLSGAEQANKTILVNCRQGMSRSPTVLIAYLMFSRNYSLLVAYNKVKDARDEIMPRYQFFDELMAFEKQHFGLAKSTATHAHNYVPIVVGAPPPPKPSSLVLECNGDAECSSAAIANAPPMQYVAGEIIESRYLLIGFERDLSTTTASALIVWSRPVVDDEQQQLQLAAAAAAQQQLLQQEWPRCSQLDAESADQQLPAADPARDSQSTVSISWQHIELPTRFVMLNRMSQAQIARGKFGEVWVCMIESLLAERTTSCHKR